MVEALIFFELYDSSTVAKKVQKTCVTKCLVTKCSKALEDMKIEELELKTHCDVLLEFSEISPEFLEENNLDNTLYTFCNRNIDSYNLLHTLISKSSCMTGEDSSTNDDGF